MLTPYPLELRGGVSGSMSLSTDFKFTKERVARLVLALAFGGAIGIVGYTFVYAKGYSYMSDDPGACANCHIMNEQFDAWMKSSHHAVATCNDCHTPKDFVGKYTTKASHGFWHSFYFTTGTFHEPIQIGESSFEVTEEACRNCHGDLVEPLELSGEDGDEKMSCIRCHRNVGHLH